MEEERLQATLNNSETPENSLPPVNKDKALTPTLKLLLTSAILLLIFIPLVYLYKSDKLPFPPNPTPTPSPTLSPTPTLTPTPTITPTPTPDPTMGWLSYSNNSLQYSLKYPSNMKLTEKKDSIENIYYDISLVLDGPDQPANAGTIDRLSVNINKINKSYDQSFCTFIHEIHLDTNPITDDDDCLRMSFTDGRSSYRYKGVSIEPFDSIYIEVSTTEVIQILGSYASPDKEQLDYYKELFETIITNFYHIEKSIAH